MAKLEVRKSMSDEKAIAKAKELQARIGQFQRPLEPNEDELTGPEKAKLTKAWNAKAIPALAEIFQMVPSFGDRIATENHVVEIADLREVAGENGTTVAEEFRVCQKAFPTTIVLIGEDVEDVRDLVPYPSYAKAYAYLAKHAPELLDKEFTTLSKLHGDGRTFTNRVATLVAAKFVVSSKTNRAIFGRFRFDALIAVRICGNGVIKPIFIPQPALWQLRKQVEGKDVVATYSQAVVRSGVYNLMRDWTPLLNVVSYDEEWRQERHQKRLERNAFASALDEAITRKNSDYHPPRRKGKLAIAG